jgi:hypothetical protein
MPQVGQVGQVGRIELFLPTRLTRLTRPTYFAGAGASAARVACRDFIHDWSWAI